jgi:hypothetical protein
MPRGRGVPDLSLFDDVRHALGTVQAPVPLVRFHVNGCNIRCYLLPVAILTKDKVLQQAFEGTSLVTGIHGTSFGFWALYLQECNGTTSH